MTDNYKFKLALKFLKIFSFVIFSMLTTYVLSFGPAVVALDPNEETPEKFVYFYEPLLDIAIGTPLETVLCNYVELCNSIIN